MSGLVSHSSSNFACRDSNVYFANCYRSADNGKTWNKMNTDSVTFSVNSLMFRDSTLFAGAENKGIYRSEDYGANWTPIKNGIVHRLEGRQYTNRYAQSRSSPFD